MKTFLLIVCFLSADILNAQFDSSQTKTDSLYFKIRFLHIYPVILNNGQRLSNKEAATILSKLPEASINYKKYRHKYNIGLYSFIGLYAGLTVYNTGFEKNKNTLKAIGLPIAFASFINSVVFISLGEAKLRKAISNYNKSVLKY